VTPPNESNCAPKAPKPTPTASTAANFAAAVLAKGGEVHRLPDGSGGFYQVAILNPGALRPKTEGGRN
jgi:hypothetical protein